MKKGISLIAVLMFMLAATTASVVVFQWIGSENFASGARLKQSEAYQSAESGIEATQAWLSGKGADVGALVDKHLSNKQKIKLNNVISRGNYNVYLVGIDTSSNAHHKFRILSVGWGRDGSEVKLAAVFDVAGLYRMRISDDPPKGKPTPVPPYFGGSINLEGTKTMTSATVRGNLTGNPATIEKDLVVTGNFNASGTGATVGETMCVGGVFDPNNDKTSVGAAYIGSSPNFLGTYGDVYCDGDMQMRNTGNGANVGNLTINGTLSFTGGKDYQIRDNLVIGDSIITGNTPQVNVAGLGSGNYFSVCGSVWCSNQDGILSTLIQGRRVHFASGKPTPTTNNCPRRDNAFLAFNGALPYTGATGVNFITSTSNGYFLSHAAPNDYSEDSRPTAARDVKHYCNTIWRPKTADDQCSDNGAKYTVDDPIASSLDTIKKFLIKASNTNDRFNSFHCLSDTPANIGPQGGVTNRGLAQNCNSASCRLPTLLNGCYEMLKNDPSKLYNGYYVIKLHQREDYSNSTALKGKFIFIYPEGTQYRPGNVFIAPTTSDSRVMIFFEEGVANEVKSADGGCVSDGAGGFFPYNYFIYSLKDITEFNKWNENCPLNGNIYFPTNSCARVHRVNNGFRLQENTDFVAELMEAGILCESEADRKNNKYCTDAERNKSMGLESTPPEGESSTTSNTLKDTWLPVASQLKVSLAGKNISKEIEPIAEFAELEPSVLVMPRIVRLSMDAFTKETANLGTGDKFSRFYGFMYLNGAKKDETSPARNCYLRKDPAVVLPVNPPSDTDLLTEGFYECTFDNSNYSNFYVNVKGLTGGATVRLNPGDDQEIDINSGSLCRNVSAVATENTTNFTVSITQERSYSGVSPWTVDGTEGSGCSIQTTGTFGNIYPPTTGTSWKIECDRLTNGGTVVTFKVCYNGTGGYASGGSVTFKLDNTSGINAVNPLSSTVRTKISPINIKRQNESNPDFVTCPEKSGSWMELICPNNISANIKIPSNEWECDNTFGGTVSWRILTANLDNRCEVQANTNSEGSFSFAPYQLEASFIKDLAWKTDTVTVTGGTLGWAEITRTGRSDTSGVTSTDPGRIIVYREAAYSIAATAPKIAICDKSLNCQQDTLYLTGSLTGTMRPTGSGRIRLENIPAPRTECRLHTPQVRSGEPFKMSNIADVDVIGYGCENALISYTITGPGSPIYNQTSDMHTLTEVGDYTIVAEGTCNGGGIGGQTATPIPCGTLNVAGELEPQIECAWGNAGGDYFIGNIPTVNVTITTDKYVPTTCEPPTVVSGTTLKPNDWGVAHGSGSNYTISATSAIGGSDVGSNKTVVVQTVCTGSKAGTYTDSCIDKTVALGQPCEVRSTWDRVCPNTVWPNGVKWNSSPVSGSNTVVGCHYVTGLGDIINVNSTIRINGTNVSGYNQNNGSNGQGGSGTRPSSISRLDDGYYIYVSSSSFGDLSGITAGYSKPTCAPDNDPELICVWEGNNANGFYAGASNLIEDGPIPAPKLICGSGTSNERVIPTNMGNWHGITPWGTNVAPYTGTDGKGYKVSVYVASGCGEPKSADCGTLLVRRAPQISNCDFSSKSGDSGDAIEKPNVTLSDPDNICGSLTNETWRYTIPSNGNGNGTFNWNFLPSANTYGGFSVTGNCNGYGSVEPKSCSGIVVVYPSEAKPCNYTASMCNNLYSLASTIPFTGNPSGSPSGSCIFATEITSFRANSPSNTYVNGQNNVNINNLPAKVDGGYYIYIPPHNSLGAWAGTTGNAPNCVDGAATTPCSFVQSWCPNVDWTTGIRWEENFSSIQGACFFLRGQHAGTTPTCDPASSCSINSGDGGYYVYVRASVNNTYNFATVAPSKPYCVGPPPPSITAPTISCNIGNKSGISGNPVSGGAPDISSVTLSDPNNFCSGTGTQPNTAAWNSRIWSLNWNTLPAAGTYNNVTVSLTCGTYGAISTTCAGEVNVTEAKCPNYTWPSNNSMPPNWSSGGCFYINASNCPSNHRINCGAGNCTIEIEDDPNSPYSSTSWSNINLNRADVFEKYVKFSGTFNGLNCGQ